MVHFARAVLGGGNARGWGRASLMPDPVPRQRHRRIGCWPQATALVPLTTGHWSSASRHSPLFSRSAPLASSRKLGSFSGSIPPWLVLTNNLSTTNTRAIWLCSGAFLSPPARFLRIHWPLSSRSTLHAPRPTPGPAGSGRAWTLPRWLLPDTDNRIGKDRMGTDHDERSLSFSMAPNRVILTEKSIRLSALAALGP